MSGGLSGLSARTWNLEFDETDVHAFLKEHPEATGNEWLAVILYDLRQRWNCGRPWSAEDYLKWFPALNADPTLKLQLVVGNYSLNQLSPLRRPH